jgi:hypothetical protein
LFSFSIVSAFLAHEPWLVLAGRRGSRQRGLLGVAAARRLSILVSASLITAIGGLALAPAQARLALIPTTVCGLMSLILMWRHAEKSVGGELMVALTFSLAFAPVALCHDPAGPLPWIAAAIWSCVFGIQTLAVHAAKSRDRRQTLLVSMAAGAALIIAGGGALTLSLVSIALMAPAIFTIAVLRFRDGPGRLRRIGRAFAYADIITLVLIPLCWAL